MAFGNVGGGDCMEQNSDEHDWIILAYRSKWITKCRTTIEQLLINVHCLLGGFWRCFNQCLVIIQPFIALHFDHKNSGPSIYIQCTQKHFLIIRSSFYKQANTIALNWQKSAWSDAHKKANCVMGADELPTQSQGQTVMKAVNGPRVSSLILTHTLNLFDVSFSVFGSEREG